MTVEGNLRLQTNYSSSNILMHQGEKSPEMMKRVILLVRLCFLFRHLDTFSTGIEEPTLVSLPSPLLSLSCCSAVTSRAQRPVADQYQVVGN